MNFTKYENYKDSGLKWLSEIPEDWELRRLKDFVKSIFGGGTPSTTNKDYWNGNIPWVSPKDMKSEIIDKAEDYITDLAIKESASSLLSPNKVLMVVRSGILKHSLPVAINKVEVALNQDMKALEPNKTLLSHFLFWKLKGQSKDVLTQCQKVGTTVESIETGNLLVFPFAVPTKAEQQAIVEYLAEKTAQIDKKIELLQAKKEKYQELRKTLINEAVTKGIDKNVELKDSGIEWLGKIPKHWKVGRVKDFLNQISETGNEIAENTYIPLENIEPFAGRLLKLASNESGETTNYFRKGDLLFSKLRPYLGKVLLAEFDGGISGEAIVYRIKPSKRKVIFSRYYFYRFLSTRFVFKVNSLTDGVKMPRTNPVKISNLEVAVPPIEEQKIIAFYLDEQTSKIDQIILTFDKNIETLNEFRKTLINDAVTGKIKIVSAENNSYDRNAVAG